MNAGSSSLKVSVVDDPGDRDAGADRPVRAVVDLGAPADPATVPALMALLDGMPPVGAVGHRVVHGGPDVLATTLVDDGVRRQLDAGAGIAPLHVPPALAILDALRSRLTVPNVVCVDTAFHASIPLAASTYAIPGRWRTEYGIRRFGFHGLSYAWALHRASALLDRPAAHVQLLVAHLGSGASVCAIRHGQSADTTMGFTPLEGLVMGTRSGTVDPGAISWLQTTHGIGAATVAAALEGDSGLRGLCGTADAREVLSRASAGDEAAVLARDVFVHRAAAGIAAMAASLERVDALVFTGGIGEHSGEIRERICRRLGVLGVASDAHAAPTDGVDMVVSTLGRGVAVIVVHAREDLEIAAEVRGLLGRPGAAPAA